MSTRRAPMPAACSATMRGRSAGALKCVRRRSPSSASSVATSSRGAGTISAGIPQAVPGALASDAPEPVGSAMDTSVRITRSEVVVALSLATDLAMGDALESGLKVCRVAVGLAEDAGLTEAERDRVFYVALLRHVGCTAENPAFAEIVGDEIAFRLTVGPLEATSPRVFGTHTLRHLVATRGLLGTAAKLARMAAER